MFQRFVSMFLLTYLIWIGLSSSFQGPELITGLAVSIIVAILLGRYSEIRLGLSFPLKVFRFIFRYLPAFVIEMVKANIDVAKRVLDPKLPINPAIVKIPLKLQGKFSRLVLANSITLTPGTLSVDFDSENIYVHWIDKSEKSSKEIKKAIVGSFEESIGGIFE